MDAVADPDDVACSGWRSYVLDGVADSGWQLIVRDAGERKLVCNVGGHECTVGGFHEHCLAGKVAVCAVGEKGTVGGC